MLVVIFLGGKLSPSDVVGGGHSVTEIELELSFTHTVFRIHRPRSSRVDGALTICQPGGGGVTPGSALVDRVAMSMVLERDLGFPVLLARIPMDFPELPLA